MKNTLKNCLFLSLIGISLLSCSSNKNDDTSLTEGIKIDKYVSSVSDTSPLLISGKDEGQDIDYIVTSQPVLFAASNNASKTTNLSLYANVASLFGEKYGTKGFPQAGLFIKSELLESENDSSIKSFLKFFDSSVNDLVNGGTNAVKYINAYSEDSDTQKARFGFASGVIKNVQQTNGLAFIKKEDNPTLSDFEKFEEPLGISVEESDLSSYYSSTIDDSVDEMEELEYSVVTPQGAPAATMAKFASNTDKVDFLSATLMSAEFSKKEKDFIVFDSVNGIKLSKKNNDSYKLVRMVTFGNLYVVSLNTDSDGVMSNDDYIVSYGENLVPDLAFKAVYGA